MVRLKYYLKKVRNQGGFTILEVLVAALIASFAVAAGMKVLIVQNENHIIQSGVTEMQQNGRAVVNELVQKIRQAGYRLEPGITCMTAWNANPDTVAVVFMAEPLCTASLSDPMSSPTADLACEGADLSGFVANTWAYIYDAVTDSGEYFWLSDVDIAGEELQHSSAALSKSYPANAKVFMLDFYKYYIDDTDSLSPKFMMAKNGDDPVVYADDIVDLQLRYTLANGAVYDTIVVDRYVREVLIEVVTRTAKSDLFVGDYRYDTLRSSAMVRNLTM